MVLFFEECVILRVITSVSFSGALRRQKKKVRLESEGRGCFGATGEHLLNPLRNEQLRTGQKQGTCTWGVERRKLQQKDKTKQIKPFQVTQSCTAFLENCTEHLSRT